MFAKLVFKANVLNSLLRLNVWVRLIRTFSLTNKDKDERHRLGEAKGPNKVWALRSIIRLLVKFGDTIGTKKISSLRMVTLHY